jgi:hypothetical protein
MRNLITETIRRFRGLSLWEVASNLGPEHAQDCLNVIPNSSGGISKLRVPTSLSPEVANLSGVGSIANFQNALGTRQVIAAVGDYVESLALDAYTPTEVDNNALNDAIWDWIQSNNIMFGANGLRMMKWTGTAWQKWGIDQATAPGYDLGAGNVVNVIADPAGTLLVRLNDTEYHDSFNHLYLSRWHFAFTYVNSDGVESNISPTVETLMFEEANHWLIINIPWGERENPAAAPENVVGWYLYGSKSTVLYGNGNVPDLDTGPLLRLCVDPILVDDSILQDGTNWQGTPSIPAPTANSSGMVVGPGTLTMVTGRRYRIAYGNSVTGHVGPASSISASTGAFVGGASTITVPAPTDTQCDQVWLYATEDGGGDYYVLLNPLTTDGSWAITAGGAAITIVDDTPDSELDKSRIAPMLNFPPPIGKYLTKFQGRVFVAGIVGAKQDIAYSGYERIFIGRPEESFPPNNRLRLSIGADEISGFGALQGGIVAFSKSNEMYSFRGSVEDVTNDAPIQYSAMLEQLPYSEGCASHYSIVETPYGLVWLGADKTIKVWNGQGPPQSLSGNIYPLLRRITAGQESNCRGLYFNWIEKEWYLLAIPIDNSTSLNRIIIVDLEPEQEKNVGAYPISVGTIDAMDIIEDVNGQRYIAFLQGGVVWTLPTTSTTTSGISA